MGSFIFSSLYMDPNQNKAGVSECTDCTPSPGTSGLGLLQTEMTGDPDRQCAWCHFECAIWRMRAVPALVTFRCQIGVVKCGWTFQGGRRLLRDLQSCKHTARDLIINNTICVCKYQRNLCWIKSLATLKVYLCFLSILSHWCTSWEYIKWNEEIALFIHNASSEPLNFIIKVLHVTLNEALPV